MNKYSWLILLQLSCSDLCKYEIKIDLPPECENKTCDLSIKLSRNEKIFHEETIKNFRQSEIELSGPKNLKSSTIELFVFINDTVKYFAQGILGVDNILRPQAVLSSRISNIEEKHLLDMLEDEVADYVSNPQNTKKLLKILNMLEKFEENIDKGIEILEKIEKSKSQATPVSQILSVYFLRHNCLAKSLKYYEKYRKKYKTKILDEIISYQKGKTIDYKASLQWLTPSIEVQNEHLLAYLKKNFKTAKIYENDDEIFIDLSHIVLPIKFTLIRLFTDKHVKIISHELIFDLYSGIFSKGKNINIEADYLENGIFVSTDLERTSAGEGKRGEDAIVDAYTTVFKAAKGGEGSSGKNGKDGGNIDIRIKNFANNKCKFRLCRTIAMTSGSIGQNGGKGGRGGNGLKSIRTHSKLLIFAPAGEGGAGGRAGGGGSPGQLHLDEAQFAQSTIYTFALDGIKGQDGAIGDSGGYRK